MFDPPELHMSWCDGNHNKDGDCVIQRRVQMGNEKGEHVDVELNGLRCDHFAIYLDDGTVLCDGGDVDRYLHGLLDLADVLAELRTLLDQSEALGEQDCDDSHNHND